MNSIYQAAMERASFRAAETGGSERPVPFSPPDAPSGRMRTFLSDLFYDCRDAAAFSARNILNSFAARKKAAEDGSADAGGTGKVIQLLTNFSYGDGVGNEVIAVDRFLKENGYRTEIWAWVIDPKLEKLGIRVKLFSGRRFLETCGEKDLVLFHHAIYTPIASYLPRIRGRLVLVYHNVTPPRYYEPYSAYAAHNCRRGLEQTAALKNLPERCVAVSEYNRQDLIGMGYTCPIDVIPILIPFPDYRREPSGGVLADMRRDGLTNILFVGRIAPNKRQEDVIAAFAVYQKRYNPRSRLILLGSGDGPYREGLERYAGELGAENVLFTGHVSFADILAYYRSADLFLCMSEHEGFCIPLVEAFIFGIPVIARDAAAVGETLGDGGILVEGNDPELTAALMDEVLASEEVRERMRQGQKERLEFFGEDEVRAKFLRWIGTVMPGQQARDGRNPGQAGQ